MLIKYLNGRHVDDMLNLGRVRISTLWHYQADETAEIGDPEEGQTGFLLRNDTAKPWSIRAATLDRVSLSIPGHARVTQDRTLQPGEETWPEGVGGFNSFVYSLTDAEAPSRAVMEKLGYDTAVEVTDLDGFARHTATAIRNHLAQEYGDSLIGATKVFREPVHYVESQRRVLAPSTIEEVLDQSRAVDLKEFFTKLNTFAYQSEFRIAYLFYSSVDTELALSFDQRLGELHPIILGDNGSPRIAPTLRLIDESEFVD